MHPFTLRFSDPEIERALLQDRQHSRGFANARILFSVSFVLLMLLTLHPSSRVEHLSYGPMDYFSNSVFDTTQLSVGTVAFTFIVAILGFVGCNLVDASIKNTAHARLGVEVFIISALFSRDGMAIFAWLNSHACGQHEMGPPCGQLETTPQPASCASQHPISSYALAQPNPLSDDAGYRVMQCAGRAFYVALLIIGVHMVYLRWYTKCTIMLMPPLSHWLAPIWGIGWLESYLFAMAVICGWATGYVLERMARNFYLVSTIAERAKAAHFELKGMALERERAMDEEAVHMISHQLKNRFIAIKGLAQSIQTGVEKHAPQLLLPRDAAHGPMGGQDDGGGGVDESGALRETFDDLLTQIRGGLRLCYTESVIRMIAHDQYTRTDAEFDLITELEQLCGTRIALTVESNVPRRIMSDLTLLLQALENFTTNATKYGTAPLRLHVALVAGVAATLRVTVHNAPGAKHRELRERFGGGGSIAHLIQIGGAGDAGGGADALSTRKGLAIVQTCADLLEAQVSLRFEPTEVVASLELQFTLLPELLRLPPSTLIAAVDDSAAVRSMDRRSFQQMAASGALDAASAQHVRGATCDEISAFPEYVMTLTPDIVLIDQNLDHPTHGTAFCKGTSLVARLRMAGYTGLVLIKSANEVDRHELSACGADGAVAKGLEPLDLNRQLAWFLSRGASSGTDGGSKDALQRHESRSQQPVVKDGLLAAAAGGGATTSGARVDFALLDSLGRDEARELVAETVVEVGDLVTKLQAHIDGRFYERAVKVAHSIKGVCVYLGSHRMPQLCDQLHGLTIPSNAEGAKEWEAARIAISNEFEELLVKLQERYRYA